MSSPHSSSFYSFVSPTIFFWGGGGLFPHLCLLFMLPFVAISVYLSISSSLTSFIIFSIFLFLFCSFPLFISLPMFLLPLYYLFPHCFSLNVLLFLIIFMCLLILFIVTLNPFERMVQNTGNGVGATVKESDENLPA